MGRSVAAPFVAVALLVVASSCGTKTVAKAPAPALQETYPVAATTASAGAPESAQHPVDVLLCDGQTKVTVPPGTPGTSVAGALMSEWLRKNPNASWESDERGRHDLEPAADNEQLVGQVDGHTYGLVTKQDVALWKAETERLALAGSEVFHSGDRLGSTIGVSCDMCHPHASNTHPETYPKFQVQLGRVVLLRDMINWCIEHPVRARPLEADDPRMRALEAYILAQRKGKVLEYGKH
jgi:hypothetical protein